ncbi:fimbrial protein [Pantoea sp.]|uniref:fimbrial protein n=1 Tax=Pantoea sp. TaxID=69393 RepID=UPI0031D2496B
MCGLSLLKNTALILLCLISVYANASKINVNVNVLGPSCIINDGNAIEIDFGDDVLSTNLSTGSGPKKTIFIEVKCTNDAPNNWYLFLEGEQWEPSIKVLKTSKENLSIVFFTGSEWLPLNEKKYYSGPRSLFIISARPESIGSAKVEPGPFTAFATVKIFFE